MVTAAFARAAAVSGSKRVVDTSPKIAMEGTAGSPTFDTRVWYVAGPTNAVASGVFKGAQRYVTVIHAGWPTTPQFRAPTGFYTGSVDFTVEF